jgi:hypothetical protein
VSPVTDEAPLEADKETSAEGRGHHALLAVALLGLILLMTFGLSLAAVLLFSYLT